LLTLVYDMPYSTVFDFILLVEKYLHASLIAADRAVLSLYTLNFQFDVSPHYLNVGSALGALEVFNDL
jgi:hypothetical protein